MNETVEIARAPVVATPVARRRITSYLWDRRELDFVLWEFFRIHETLMGQAPYESTTRDDIEALMAAAVEHTRELDDASEAADRQPARLKPDGTVAISSAFSDLWARHKRDWFWLRQQGEALRARDTEGRSRHPTLVVQLVMEMFAGANASFMTYGAFTPSALAVIRARGTEAQKKIFVDRMERVEWDACFCATESQAGSDLMAIRTEASLIEGDVYSVVGEKRYITAGMHELTANTVYVVLGRVRCKGLSALSCFLVPRYWPNDDGTLSSNFVDCHGVEDKMGLNGCANTHLVFGRTGTTRGYLLGNQPHVALLQLSILMRKARISTGNIAVAMASSAYLHAVRYARKRVQGPAFDKASDIKAARVPIVEHKDVQRMLLDMKSRVEGCRLLLGRISMHSAFVQRQLSLQHCDPASFDKVELERHGHLAMLLSPVAKAFISDEAWDVAATAVQVHGAVGYLRELPLERYLRDLKILTIWEGTNYIQSQDLLRDKLGFGIDLRIFTFFENEVLQALNGLHRHPSLQDEERAVRGALDTLKRTLQRVSEYAISGRRLLISQFCTRYLSMFGHVVLAWNLVEAAGVALDALSQEDVVPDDRSFYLGKLATAQFFCRNVLPSVASCAAVICDADRTYVDVDPAMFGFEERPCEP